VEGTGAAPTPASHGELIRVFLRISLLGFGGPNAHLALMLDEVVDRRKWLTRQHFLHLVSATNLLPGPNSSEVAIHVGYTQRGWTGALATGLAFLLPTFALVTTAASLYFRYGSLPSVTSLFWGLRPVVLAIIVSAGVKLARVAVTSPVSWSLAGSGVLAGVAGGTWAVPVMLLGGAAHWGVWRWKLGAVGRDKPPASPTTGSDEGTPDRIPLALPLGLTGASALGATASVFLTHLWIGCVLFGGGYVLIVLLEPQAVDRFGWLSSAQFLDGVALTQAVPGPISTLAAFVGYGAAGLPGAVAGTTGIYLPAFTAVLLLAPHMTRLRSVEPIRAVLDGVGAVVAGAILGVALTLLPPAVPDLATGGLLAAALLLLAGKVPAYGVIVLGLVAGALRVALG
jgi:chromate transporter